MRSSQGGEAPIPKPGLTAAIVGHRPERIADAKAVSARLTEVVAAIPGALAAAGGEGDRVRLASALAEGADRMAAHTALDAGLPLDVILPFPVEEYERDFARPASRKEFQALLARAASVLTLDGAPDQRDRAYDAVGLALLDNADLLIAVWDGEPGRGRGGTREVIEEAARRAMPVVVITADGASVTIRTAGRRAGSMRLDDVPERPLSDLPALIEAMMRAPSGDDQAALSRMLTHRPRKPLVHGVWPLLLRLVGVGTKRTSGAGKSAAPSAPTPLADAFLWWDGAAVQAAQAFRSAVIVNFALAALAVVLASLSVFGGHYKWLFVTAEVATILLLLANTASASRRCWQQRWLESRQLAELLRVGLLLRGVGIGRGVGNPGGGWISWHADAAVRATPPETVDLADPARAAQAVVSEIAGQAAWNEATAHRMHLAAHRIERFGEVLFVLVLLAAVAWLALHLAAPARAYALQGPLTALTGGLPAVATASYGIRIILDFQGVAERAGRIASGLKALLERWEAGPRDGAALQTLARGASDVMLGDVAAWRLLAEGRRLTIPG